MRPPERIETKRLVIRVPHLSDAQSIFDGYARDSDVTRYLVWRPHTDVHETERFLAECIEAWEQCARFPWVITLKDDGELIGMVEIRVNSFKADVGYVIARRWWGKGLATEALRPIVEWAMAQPNIYRVWALCDVANVASARVLEKAGMKREGLLRRNMLHPNASSEPRDSCCYAVIKEA
jgi:[ribosomal protein S5]-alanine N-acetyltransferase